MNNILLLTFQMFLLALIISFIVTFIIQALFFIIKAFKQRIGLILTGMLLVFPGKKGILEPLLTIPMGIGMAAVKQEFNF